MEKTWHHTPGPWRVQHYLDEPDKVKAIIGPEGERIVSMDLPFMLKETKANAQLIAAAPALKFALKRLLAVVEKHYANGKQGLDVFPELMRARSAITAAEKEDE